MNREERRKLKKSKEPVPNKCSLYKCDECGSIIPQSSVDPYLEFVMCIECFKEMRKIS